MTVRNNQQPASDRGDNFLPCDVTRTPLQVHQSASKEEAAGEGWTKDDLVEKSIFHANVSRAGPSGKAFRTPLGAVACALLSRAVTGPNDPSG